MTAMTEESKGRKIGYWITTALLVVPLLGGGVMDLIAPPEVAEAMEKLGYPLYLPALLGVAKILAAIAILAPRFARLKEWAYAGVAIDLIGAIYSHVMSNEADQILAPVLFLGLMFASWYLRPADRKLPNAPVTTGL
jgi:uncharacterized membrane protein YphA (DoxX/SURF4 family)